MLIKDIPKEERPRERLLKYGVSNLSNEELLAIIIKNGTKGSSAKDLAIQVLTKVKHISDLKNLNLHTLSDIKGLGQIKRLELLVVIELGKRIFFQNNVCKKTKYLNPKLIYEDNRYLFLGLKQEYFYVIYLDTKKKFIERKLLFMGTIDTSLIHPREVFKNAYLCSASSFVCIHNHPSGDLIPSKADLEITKTLVEIGRMQGIDLVDHLIISDTEYFSFYENHLME